MRRIAVDLSQSTCAVAEEARPAYIDFKAKTPKTNDNGEVLSSLRVLVHSTDEISVIQVSVPTQALSNNLKVGDPINVSGLVANPGLSKTGALVTYWDAGRVELAAKSAKAAA